MIFLRFKVVFSSLILRKRSIPLGDSLELTDEGLSIGIDSILKRADLVDFTDLFAFEGIRSA